MSDTQEPKPDDAAAAAPPSDPEAAEPSELEKARGEMARMKDQLLRTAADFDNFRKRSRREAEDARARGRDETLAELLPVFDNLARAAQAAVSSTDVSAIQSGIQLVLGQIEGALSRVGVTPIEAVGKTFDPTRHDAIQQVERADVAPGTVVEEVQRGYVNGDKLVRAALVIVARAPAAPKPPTPPEEGGADGGKSGEGAA